MLVHWIWFAHRPKVSDKMKMELLRAFGSAEEVYAADSDAFSHISDLSRESMNSLLDKSLAGGEKILSDARRAGISVVTIGEDAYPTRLKHIPDPPAVLYYKGNLPDFDSVPMVGVVGTRKASAYGLNTAKRMGYQIAKCGGTVVSGLADGIDAMAMNGALNGSGPVIGVLGCGADIVYPAKNRFLFEETARYGCILSEFAPGTPPQRYNFPRRNRIISGICAGVLVVEAPEKSGALITANLALEQGRDVFCVPGNIDLPSFVGSNHLIRDGAIPVSCGWDVMSEYTAQFPDKIRKDMSELSSLERPSVGAKVAQKREVPKKIKDKNEKSNKKVVDKKVDTAYSDVNKDLPKLSSDEQKIVSALTEGERLVDDVIAEVGLSAGKVSVALTMLTVKGVIKRLPGNRIGLK